MFSCDHCKWQGEAEQATNITGNCGLFCPDCGSKINTEIEYITKPRGNPDEWDYDGPGWYFWKETWSDAHGPYPTEADAQQALKRYTEAMTAMQGHDNKGMYIHLIERDNDKENQ